MVSDLKDLQARALEVRRRYNELNHRDGHDVWGPKDYAIGFVGDVGALMKLVMAKENMRNIDDVDVELRHELADCLWSVFVLANHYNIDLEKEFMRTMGHLEKRIAKELAT
jgi:NTP pyrophosphatase (non-canonical NTP hydrolase)